MRCNHGTQQAHWRDLEDGVSRAVMLKLLKLQRVWGTGRGTCLHIPTFTPGHPARHWYPDQVRASQGRDITCGHRHHPPDTDVTCQTQTSPLDIDVTSRHERHHQVQTSPTRYRHHLPDTDVTTRHRHLDTDTDVTSRHERHHQVQTSRYRCHLQTQMSPPDTDVTTRYICQH